MNEQEFQRLLEKYFQGTLTEQEANLLHQFDAKMLQKKAVPFKDKKHRLEVKSSIYKAIQKKQQNTRKTLWRVAAGFLLLIGLGTTAVYYSPSKSQIEYSQITRATNWGQQHDVTLPDGSIVRLNAGSSISYPEQFERAERVVQLSGEAFFDVVKNSEAPFVIHTEEVTTTVLGTSFNINTHDENNVIVTVATGKVRVSANSDSDVVVTSTQQAVYNKKTKHMRTQKVNLAEYLDWKDGILRFEDVTIAEAATKLQQWYNVTIKVLNDDIANCRFSGKFNNETLPTVLESLANLKSNMKYTVLENAEIHINGKCN